jgi:RHS repeat-associated protein
MNRYYYPAIGRYIEPDPLDVSGYLEVFFDYAMGESINQNPYLYGANNPIDLIDPFGLYHYKPSRPGHPVEPVNPNMGKVLTCMDQCLGTDLGISGGSEKRGCGTNGGSCHSPDSAHYSGDAADVSKRMSPGLNPTQVMCCAKKCGAGYVINEGDHYHVQDRPGLGGSSGSLPTCGCNP